MCDHLSENPHCLQNFQVFNKIFSELSTMFEEWVYTIFTATPSDCAVLQYYSKGLIFVSIKNFSLFKNSQL